MCALQMAACAAEILEAARPGHLRQGSNMLKSLELALQPQQPPGQPQTATDFSSIAGTGLTPRAVEASTDQPGAGEMCSLRRVLLPLQVAAALGAHPQDLCLKQLNLLQVATLPQRSCLGTSAFRSFSRRIPCWPAL